VHHLGTFNANPVSAAAGIATLKRIATGLPHDRANRMASMLRQGMDDILYQEHVAGYVYGDVSIFHVYLEAHPGTGVAHRHDLMTNDAAILKGIPKSVVTGFQKLLLARGVDLVSYTGGVTSAAHTETDIQNTLEIFQDVIRSMVKDKIIATLK
jgi:glutamate-1-semialdehyde 2,1-aminomutase